MPRNLRARSSRSRSRIHLPAAHIPDQPLVLAPNPVPAAPSNGTHERVRTTLTAFQVAIAAIGVTATILGITATVRAEHANTALAQLSSEIDEYHQETATLNAALLTATRNNPQMGELEDGTAVLVFDGQVWQLTTLSPGEVTPTPSGRDIGDTK